jgi:hypothetical protein
VLAVVVTTVIAVPTAASASPEAASPASASQHPTHRNCNKPAKAGLMSCQSVVRDDVT